MASLLRSRKFWAFAAPSTALGTYIGWDRYRARQIGAEQAAKAKLYGEQPLQVGEPLRCLAICIPKKVLLAESGEKVLEDSGIKAHCKQYVIPLLTLAGIDYRWFAHADHGSVLQRWVDHYYHHKAYTSNDKSLVDEDYVQPMSEQFLRDGLVATTSEMYSVLMQGKHPDVRIFFVDLDARPGFVARIKRFFTQAAEQRRIGDGVLDLLKACS